MRFLGKYFNRNALFASLLAGSLTHYANNDFDHDKIGVDSDITTIGQLVKKVPDTPLLPIAIGGLTLFAYPFAARKAETTQNDLRERFKRRSDEDIRRTAYHEAGHALLKVLHPSWMDIENATILAQDNCIGHITSKAIKPNFTRQEAINEMACLLAAKIVEHEVFGAYNTGCGGDLHQATSLAENMVKAFGMGKDVPLKNYYHPTVQQTLTDDDKRMLNSAVNQIVEEGEALARKTIRENRPALDAIAARLIEIRNPYRPWGNKLKGSEIKAIVAKHTQESVNQDVELDPASTL